MAAPAAADDDGQHRGIPGNYTGGDVSDDGSLDDPTLEQQAKDKAALLEKEMAVRSGSLSAAEYEEARDEYVLKYDVNEPNLRVEASALLDPVPSSKTLSFSHRAQSTNFYCGPASGVMLVMTAARGSKPASKYNGASLSQANMAKSAHMNTDAVGATNWSTRRFVTGVNRWRGSNFYVQDHAPTGTDLTNYMISNINLRNLPLAADTVEFPGGLHYNGHPNLDRPIGHWIMAYGFSSYGGTGKWGDPSTSVWSGVNETFSYGNTNFANRFLQSNGVAW